MRPILTLQPIHNSSADILKTFLQGKSLSCDQQNFLEWHQHELSNAWYDPILNYYLKSKRNHQHHGIFLLPHEEMNLENIQSLKNRILSMLKDKFSQVSFNITYKQFLDFKHYTIHELIFWHGNQFLTGEPFYPSCIPPVIYFQWGNLFGIVKYLVLSTDKALKANLLIFFEDMQERNLDECVADYQKHLEKNISLQHEIVEEQKIIARAEKHFAPTPRLTPSHYFLADHI